MPRWELFAAIAETNENGLRPLWYWRRIEGGNVSRMSDDGFETLEKCVEDARNHGLSDEPINVVMQTQSANGEGAT